MRVLAILNVNGSEYLIIAVAALIVLGPEQLPSALRRFGSALRQFREISDKMRTEFVAGINELDPTTWQGKGTDDDPIIPRGSVGKPVSPGGPMDQTLIEPPGEPVIPDIAAAPPLAPTDPWGRPITESDDDDDKDTPATEADPADSDPSAPETEA